MATWFPSACLGLVPAFEQVTGLVQGQAPAQTPYLQGNGPKLVQGMFKGTIGGLELSELTVFWKIIVRLKRQNPVRRVRKPRLGRVVPQCPLWVISRPFSTAVRMSAFGGKADVNQGVAECPLLAISGHIP